MARRVKDKPSQESAIRRQQRNLALLTVVLFVLIVAPPLWRKIRPPQPETILPTTAQASAEAEAVADSIAMMLSAENNRWQARQQQARRATGAVATHRNRQFDASQSHSGRATKTVASRHEAELDVYGTPLRRKAALVFELNSADTTDLQQLYGIGTVRARRIVDYRERLGGFVSLRQLLEIYGITEDMLDEWRPHLTLDTSAIVHIDMNHAGLDVMRRHPYLDYFQARAIVDYRNRGHLFQQPDDLLMLAQIDDTTVLRLTPYMTF